MNLEILARATMTLGIVLVGATIIQFLKVGLTYEVAFMLNMILASVLAFLLVEFIGYVTGWIKRESAQEHIAIQVSQDLYNICRCVSELQYADDPHHVPPEIIEASRKIMGTPNLDTIEAPVPTTTEKEQQ